MIAAAALAIYLVGGTMICFSVLLCVCYRLKRSGQWQFRRQQEALKTLDEPEPHPSTT